jgi:AraC-like DNA-binding protein
MPANAERISIRASPLAILTRGLKLPLGGVMPESSLGLGLGVRHVVASAGTNTAGFRYRHRHPAWIIVGTLAGHARVECGALRTDVEPGSVYLIPPNVPFDESVAGPASWEWAVVLAHATAKAPLMAGLPSTAMAFRGDFHFFERLIGLILRLNRRESGDEWTALGLLMELVGECRRQATAQRTGRSPGSDSVFVARATVFMREQLREPVTLAMLARHCHMSQSSFSHRFKAETGLTPMLWLARERMQVARRLLLDGRTAGETADELGFANPFHFSRVFTRIEGVPPSHFQRLSRTPH